METHFPDSEKGQAYNREPVPQKSLQENLSQTEFITVEKVKWSFSSFRPLKAAGLDGIKPIVLQNLGPVMLNRITNLYKCTITLGYVPTDWCNSKVIFIPCLLYTSDAADE